MAKVELKAKKRQELGKKVKAIRQAGQIPAVIYGRKFKATAISVDLKEFLKKVLLSEQGRNLIFDLKITDDGKSNSVPVITHGIQYNHLTDDIFHLDFMHVVMDEKIKTKIPIELVGLAIGVKEDGGVLVHGLRELEVKCLPGEIPDKYLVDVSALKINESLHVSDLKTSDKVEFLVEATEMIATVSPPTKEEVEVPAVEAVPEGAEGAVAAEGAEAVAKEEVKEKSAPGAAPAKGKAPEKPVEKAKK